MKLFMWQCFAFSLFVSCKSEDVDLVNVITLPSGNRIRGVLLESHYSQRPYVEFRGLPYAYPPVGDLRFKVRITVYNLLIEGRNENNNELK